MKDIVSVMFLLHAFCVIARHMKTTQYAHINESVILTCHQSKLAERLRWLRNNTILTDGQDINEHGHWHRKIALDYKNEVGKYNLRIRNVSSDDFGEYICEIQIDQLVSYLRILLINKDFQTLSAANRVSRKVQEIITAETFSSDVIITGSVQTTLHLTEQTGNQEEQRNSGILTLVFSAVSCLLFGLIICMANITRRRVKPSTTATHKT